MFINCLRGSVAKASDTQAVGHGIYLEVILYNCV